MRKMQFDRQQFIAKFDELRSSRKMGQYYECDKATIIRYAKEIGYDYTSKPLLNKEQIKEIESLYGTISAKQLAEKYGISKSRISQIWMKAGLNGHRSYVYNFNHDYFEKIDRPDKAYFLGLIASDGCVYRRNNGSKSQAMIKITLQERDREILQVFKRCVGSEKPLYINDGKPSVTIELISDKMANDLAKYNIVENKTLSYEMVPLNPELMNHFLRGYFDGDGGLTVKNKQYQLPYAYVASICGFRHNIINMKQYLDSIGIHLTYEQDNRSYGDGQAFGNIRTVNKKQTYEFLSYIYKDCSDVFIKRKKELADMFFDIYKERRVKYAV